VAYTNGGWTDLISDFMLYTQDYQSSEIHRTWSAITLVGGACERRIWLEVGSNVNYPNLYVFLVAPPGYGKGIIDVVRHLWYETRDLEHSASNGEMKRAFNIAPQNLTRASLIDDLQEAKQTRILEKVNPLKNQGSPTFIYHTLLIPAEEFELLLPVYDPHFISTVNAIWNNPATHEETRRHGPAKEVTIINPQFTIIGGVQPAYFVSHFPEYAWETGLARRAIMIYSDMDIVKDPFHKSPGRERIKEHILHRLGMIATKFGRMTLSNNAEGFIRDWHMEGGPPTPTHSKLNSYKKSRTQILIKLAMIAAISRTGEMFIQSEDAKRALDWMLEAEARMPDVFRAMTGKSDSQILEELHYFLLQSYRDKKKPVHERDVYEFLTLRATTDKIAGLILTAEKTQRMVRVSNDSWMPRPKLLHGVA